MSEHLIATLLVFYFCVLFVAQFWASLNQLRRYGLIFLALLSFVLSCWYFWPLIVAECFPKWDDNKLGDKYGALSAIFTSLAFAGLIFTILLQQKQIRDVDKENFVRKFENAFFRLQDAYYKIIERTELNMVRHHYNTQKLEAFQSMSYAILGAVQVGPVAWDKVAVELVQRRWPGFFNRYEDKLAHYFRILYHIFKLIDTEEIDKEDKDFYARLIRAQLTSAELTLLFFNGFSDSGENFKDYVERFALLKHFPKDFVEYNQPLLDFYKACAYEDASLTAA
jgi:hypothetical protein